MKNLLGLILSLLMFSCDAGENEIFIIPKNYTGYIVIIYNQQNTAVPKHEDKKRVYEIPVSGVLKTQFKAKEGWAGFPQFYYEKVSPENQINFVADRKKLPADTVVATGAISGSANKDLAGKQTVKFALYYVGDKAQIDTAYEAAEKLDIVKLAD